MIHRFHTGPPALPGALFLRCPLCRGAFFETVTTRQLTEDEAAALFPDLPVTAHVIFRTSDMDAGNSPEVIGFEGNIENIRC